MEEFLVLLVRAEAHDALDAGAIVPAAVEQHDFAAGGKMGHVALEIPLGAFALVGSRQRGDPADPRVKALGDALDDPALAGGVAALEEDDHLELFVLDPVLQLHQLALHPEQLLEVDAPIERSGLRMFGGLVEPVVIDLQLELFVEAVEHFAVDEFGACYGVIDHDKLTLELEHPPTCGPDSWRD